MDFEEKGYTPDIYGQIVYRERMKKEMTRNKLAEIVGVSPTAIEFWEQGKRQMTLENANKVFDALGVTVAIGRRTKYKLKDVLLLENKEEFR